MKIGILGSGIVAKTIAGKLDSLGHAVTLGTRDVKATLARNEPDMAGGPSLRLWLESHPRVTLATHAEAAAHGELVINALSGQGALAGLRGAASALAGKILVDISNPLDFSKGMPPTLFVCNTDSLAEQIQRTYPQLKVVKGLNTLNAYLMVAPRILPGEHNIFLSGNEADAKDEVRGILRSFGWNDNEMIDLGDITTARGTEQLLPIWVRLWGALQNPMFNFKIVMGPKPA